VNQWIRYSVGGGATYLLKAAGTSFLVELVGMQVRWGYGCTMAGVLLFSFWYNRRITFNSSGRPLEQLLVYLFVLLTTSFLDYALVIVLTEQIRLPYILAITTVTLTLFVLKFPIFRYLIFREGHYDRSQG
jgi:putative flippase GtrA